MGDVDSDAEAREERGSGWVLALRRFGGVLVAPRRTVAAAASDDGRYDAWWLTLLYVLGCQVQPIFEGLASTVALRSTSGVVVLVAALGRVLLTPVVVLLLCETVVGQARAYRAALCLVPLVVVCTILHVARRSGVEVPGPNFVAEVVGGLASAALAAYVQAAIPPERSVES